MLMQGLDWDKYGLPSIVEKDLSLPSSAVCIVLRKHIILLVVKE